MDAMGQESWDLKFLVGLEIQTTLQKTDSIKPLFLGGSNLEDPFYTLLFSHLACLHAKNQREPLKSGSFKPLKTNMILDNRHFQ